MTSADRAPALRFYNPDWLDDADLIGNFVARRAQLDFLTDELQRAPLRGTVTHYLLIGVRGAGKTTLLKRLAVAIRQNAGLADHLIALSFPEELYEVKGLADFWWAACEALADELDRAGRRDAAGRLENAIDARRRQPRPADAHDAAGLRLLLDTCAGLQRRPVLLVDNLDLILRRIDKSGRKLNDPHAHAYWALREALSRPDAPVTIAGSVRLSEPFTDYDKAFYDFFVPQRLGKLSLADMQAVFDHLALNHGGEDLRERIRKQPGRLRALYEMTGGNPRALGLLFELLRQGPNSRAVDDFERLLDLTTPYYKARFEDLPEQAQVVMHALAIVKRDFAQSAFGHTAAAIALHTGLETRTVSAQLDVLVNEGVAEKDSTQKGRTQYRIAEQLFRLWLQMRSTRRIRQNVVGLTEFLEAFYEREECEAMIRDADAVLQMPDDGENTVDATFAPGDLPPESALDYAHHGDVQESEAGYRRAIELAPADAWPWHALGTLLADHLQRYDEAEAAYRKAIELDPVYALVWRNLGRLLATHLDRPDEAEAAFKHVLELDENDGYARQLLAEISERRALKECIEAIAAGNWIALRSLLIARLLTSPSIPEWMTGPAFTDAIVARALRAGHGAQLLDVLREAGFERFAAPLMYALSAAIDDDPERLGAVEPEARNAAMSLYQRLTAGFKADAPE